jgi:hypothetical protein
MSLLAAVGVPLAADPGSTNVSVTNMPESGLIVLSIGAMLLLACLLLPPVLAGRAPRQKGPASTPPWSGPVQGGVHMGDGRSVAPHRDAPAEGFDQDEVARGRAGVQATVIRDDEELSGTGRQPSGEPVGGKGGESAGRRADEPADEE